MQGYIILVGMLHAAFAFLEMFPWSNPVLLDKAASGLPDIADGPGGEEPRAFTPPQQSLVATIVHNAGIYNLIMAGGLFWAAYRGEPADELAFVLLVGAMVAGIFGTATLKSPFTAVQAILGLAGAILVGGRLFPLAD